MVSEIFFVYNCLNLLNIVNMYVYNIVISFKSLGIFEILNYINILIFLLNIYGKYVFFF